METMSSKIFSSAVCVNYSYMIHVLQHFMQFPIIYLCFTIHAGGVADHVCEEAIL